MHRADLEWHSVEDSIKYRAFIAMRLVYREKSLLDPPNLLGPQHTYSTWCPSTYANADRCHLSRTQISWSKVQNELPQDILSEWNFISTLSGCTLVSKVFIVFCFVLLFFFCFFFFTEIVLRKVCVCVCIMYVCIFVCLSAPT